MVASLNEIANRFVKFAGVGVVGTASHYTVLLVLVNFLATNAVVASCFGYVVGGIVNYVLNHQFTFESSEPHTLAAPKFFAIAFVGFFINASAMSFFLNYFDLHYLVSQIIATSIVLTWNFVGNACWTFKRD